MTGRVVVPVRLTRPHKVVRAAREAAVGVRVGEDGRIRIGPRRGVLHVVVSRPLLRRALLIAQAVFSEAERRGWGVQPFDGSGYDQRPGAAVVVRGHSYAVEVHEETETVPFTKGEIAEWQSRPSWVTYGRGEPPPQMKRKRATGRLRLSLPNGFHGGRANWTEGPRGPLEAKLASVFSTLETRAEEDDRQAEEATRRAEQLARERVEREEGERRVRAEEARVRRLRAEIEAWREAAHVRAYVDALRRRLPELDDEERVRIAAWCEWAGEWVERADPVIDTPRIVGLNDEADDGCLIVGVADEAVIADVCARLPRTIRASGPDGEQLDRAEPWLQDRLGGHAATFLVPPKRIHPLAQVPLRPAFVVEPLE
jgi:hypothetical protein